MAALTIQSVPAAGLADVVFGAAAGGGDTVAAGGHRAGGYDNDLILLLIANGDASSKTVTAGGVALVVAAGDTGAIPLFREGVGDPTVAITYSAVTSVTVAAVQITG